MTASPNENSDFQKLSFPFLDWSTYFLDIESLSINTGSFHFLSINTGTKPEGCMWVKEGWATRWSLLIIFQLNFILKLNNK